MIWPKIWVPLRAAAAASWSVLDVEEKISHSARSGTGRSMPGNSRRWLAVLHGGGGAALLRRQVKQRGGRRLLDLFAISEKIQGSYCKTKITPKLGLK